MLKDPVYQVVIGLARTLFFSQGLKFTITGIENIPKKSGAVVVTNHTGYLDFTYVGLPFRKHRRFVRFMAKKEIFEHPVAGPIMKALKHIPVDRTDGSVSYNHAIRLLKNNELVGIFPESTISRSFEVKNLKSGAVRMSQETGQSIIPVLLVGSQRVWTKGHPKRLGRTNTPIHIAVLPPWYPEGDPVAATQQLHEIMDRGVRKLWGEYAAAEGPLPQGAYWVPARLGGGAPTFEEAQAEDLKVEQERQRIRHLRSDLSAFAEKLRETGRELSVSAREFGDQTKAQFRGATTAMSEESARARLQAKEQYSAMMAQFRTSVEHLADEVAEGAKEGKESVRAAAESIRAAFKEAYEHVEEASAQGLEQTQQQVYSLVAQSKLIRDRLPQRLEKLVDTMPEAIVADFGTALDDGTGAVQQETAEALLAQAEAGATIIVTYQATETPDLSAIAAADPYLVPIPLDASPQGVTNVVAKALKESARKPGEAIMFTGREAHAEALMYVGVPAVVVDSDWALMRTADWVIESAANGGVAHALEMLTKQFHTTTEEPGATGSK